MNRLLHTSLLFTLLLSLGWSGCRKVEPDCVPDAASQQLGQAPVGFPPIPFPTENSFTKARWDLGKRLFYDPVLSVDSTLSCGSCHHQALAFADDKAFSPGVEDRPGTRNAPSLANLAYFPLFLREGSVPTLEMQILVPIQEENEFDHNIVLVAEKLKRDSSYVEMCRTAYDREPDAFTITRAIATFERTLVSGNSLYDQYERQGCETALSKAQKRGKELFFSERTQCGSCHGGLNLTNHAFENNGLYKDYADIGRMRFTNDSSDLARFKVPSLRNVALTAPYMHDGSILTLEAVIDHYSAGGANHIHQSEMVRPLALTEREKDDLKQFLESFTDMDFVSNPLFQE